MEVVQVNLNHCEAAQDLLWQATVEENGDVLLISEPYRTPIGSNNWVSDKTGMAAIWATGKFPIQRVVSCAFEGFTIAVVNGVYFCSCYAPPRWDLEKFTEMLDNIVTELCGRTPVVIAGDFNAWAVEWGSKRTNSRGDAVLETLAQFNVVLGNVGTTPTFRRNDRTSIIDVTFCSPVLAQSLNWRVSEAYTLSDHRVVRYYVNRRRSPAPVPSTSIRGWKTELFDVELFAAALNFGDFGETLDASGLVAALAQACDATMPRRKAPKNAKSPAYWWNTSIKRHRDECIAVRRKLQRERCPVTKEQLRASYVTARSDLKREIKASKRRHFHELCATVAREPWGSAFKVLMGKERKHEPVERCPIKLKGIIEQLFPTHDAPVLMLENGNAAFRRKRCGARYCAAITIDVKNAFNSASWEAIAVALQGMSVPPYLCRVLRSYLNGRVLQYDTEEGVRTVNITAGVPHGSVLGPTLWNVMYDGVLTLALPPGAQLTGFADDIALTVTGESIEEVELLATDAVGRIDEWMKSVRLEIAHAKPEFILISSHKEVQKASIMVGSERIESVRNLKYLGVKIDDRLRFKDHLEEACRKAMNTANALASFTPNIGGPSSSIRSLHANVATSMLRYGAPVWAHILTEKQHQNAVNKVYRRLAMRVASAYRTISYEAVCVIANMMPLCIILEEDRKNFRQARSGEPLTAAVRAINRAASMEKWQNTWSSATSGRWTFSLIPDVTSWLGRKHGDVNFYVTQFLSGHGCFRSYLHRFRHASLPRCSACVDVDETAEHVLFHCPRFAEERQQLSNKCGTEVCRSNLMQLMLQSGDLWEATATTMRLILVELQRKWREDQLNGRA
ncbi:uncharacterized protein LOC128307518 [Anopheles moucheti]|uniref:uncharacterized protein LOC128307518 n=1 Tax=Anopheles moucheti TaxID=186751 RepID=UPI0022F02B10|nr:uncharacterized protein LOC128307518 [Anopheles moucheti]